MNQSVLNRHPVVSASFRDPAGRLLLFGDRVVRVVNAKGADALRTFLATSAAQEFVDSQRLVSTKILDARPDEIDSSEPDQQRSQKAVSEFVVEHERVALRTFPYEWPPEMLHAAGVLMLDLAERVLNEGFSLKDATPYNVLFRGPRPVFVDLLSFERRDEHDPTWLPLNQFTQTVLLPLLVNKHFGLRLDQTLSGSRDGLEPSEVARLCGLMQKLRPLFLTMVSLPTWLNGKGSHKDESIYRPKRLRDPKQASFILRQQFNRLRRQLAGVEPSDHNRSGWSDYMVPDRTFSAEYLRRKETFVRQVLEEIRPMCVLDVGCNTGHFSRLAAQTGASVVAIDQDPVVAGAVWRRAATDSLDILPLVVNLARPTPAFGWRNEECPSFLERSRGRFDAVLMLAVIHHLLVTEQIPLNELLRLAAEITTGFLVAEFVSPADTMFQRIARGRDELFLDLDQESFEANALDWFEIVRHEKLNDTRSIYLLRNRNHAANA